VFGISGSETTGVYNEMDSGVSSAWSWIGSGLIRLGFEGSLMCGTERKNFLFYGGSGSGYFCK
jgi:hypothetical protein